MIKLIIPEYTNFRKDYYIYIGLWPDGTRYETSIGLWPVSVKFWYHIHVRFKDV